MKGGMQTSGIKSLYCKCGKETSSKYEFPDGKEISQHFGKKSTYWHIYDPEQKKITRTFKIPKELE